MIGNVIALPASQAVPGNAPGNRLLAALPEDALALLEPDLRRAPFSQGDICFDQGDPVEHVFFPETGMISLLVITKGGDMIETSSIGRNGAAGLQSAFGYRQSFTRAVVQIGGWFSVIPASRFERAAAGNGRIRDLVYRYTEILWAEAQQLTACNAIHDGASRLCRWLLQSADLTGSSQLPLTQESLAGILGVRRTTVTLLAQELQQKGIVRYSRGKIIILDRPALEACACECYEVIKHDNLLDRTGVRF
jgi:CRP-like cAMP-binding protein